MENAKRPQNTKCDKCVEDFSQHFMWCFLCFERQFLYRTSKDFRESTVLSFL